MWGGCENIKLWMSDYELKILMFSIDIGGYDIVLGVAPVSSTLQNDDDDDEEDP